MKRLWRSWWRAIRRWIREPRVVWRVETEVTHITVEVQHRLPFFIFLITFFWYVASPSPVALMSAVGMGGIVLSAFLWARSQARGIRGQRRLHFSAMQVGDELEEMISLDNRTMLPVLWAEFVDRSNIPGYTVSSARAAEPGAHTEWRAHTICTRRGIFTLGPWELRIGEPFGIFLVRQVYLQGQEILVYPPLASLPEQVLPHRGALGDHRPLNQPLRAETIASTSVRSYAPGDPLRHIHWRTTARRMAPFVKVFAPEAASNVWLLPDFNADEHVDCPGAEGTVSDSSQESMVTVVASLAAAMLQEQLSVGMFASAGKEVVVLPRLGQAHLWTILQALAPLHTVPGRSLEDVLDRARGLISGNDLLILVTPSLHMDWIGALRRISRSRGSSGRAEVVLLDPVSFGSPVNQGAAESLLPLLLEQGIPANVLRREDVQPITGYYGEISRWEFSVTGTGKVVARKAPRAAASIMADSQSALFWKSME